MGKKKKPLNRFLSAPAPKIDKSTVSENLHLLAGSQLDFSSYNITEKRLPKISQLHGVRRVMLTIKGREHLRMLASQLSTTVREEDEEELEKSSIPFVFQQLDSKEQRNILGAKLIPNRGFIAYHTKEPLLEYLIADLPRNRRERKILGKLLNPAGVEIYKLVPMDIRGKEWSLEKTIKKWDEKEMSVFLRRKTDNLWTRVWDLCRGVKSRGVYWIYKDMKAVIKFTEMRKGDDAYRMDFSRKIDGDTYLKTIGLGISMILTIHESQFTHGLHIILDDIAQALKSPDDDESDDLADEFMQLI